MPIATCQYPVDYQPSEGHRRFSIESYIRLGDRDVCVITVPGAAGPFRVCEVDEQLTAHETNAFGTRPEAMAELLSIIGRYCAEQRKGGN